MVCSTAGCGNTKILARGLCQPCYHRLRRSGSVERSYVVNTGVCSVDGCGKASFAKNLCQHHYSKAQHPLNHAWRLIRSRYPTLIPASWDRFEAFLADVGERPGERWQLRRIRQDQPYSAQNVHWIAPVGVNGSSMSKEQQAVYGREWALKKKYDLTGAQYAEMLASQGGVCAVCGGVETHVHKSGKVKDLAVDHDHTSGLVRGLLCMNCNQGIGRLGDDPDRLEVAARYLRRHRGAEG